MTTEAPRSANARAMARPSPADPPVTRTTFPRQSAMFVRPARDEIGPIASAKKPRVLHDLSHAIGLAAGALKHIVGFAVAHELLFGGVPRQFAAEANRNVS